MVEQSSVSRSKWGWARWMVVVFAVMAVVGGGSASVASARGLHTFVSHSARVGAGSRIPGAAANEITGYMTEHGGQVQSAAAVYVDYWGWTGSDPVGEQSVLEGFLNHVGGSGWLGTVDQYGAGNPSGLLKGTWTDTTNTIPTSPTQAQLAAEADQAALHFGVAATAVQTISETGTVTGGSFTLTYMGAPAQTTAAIVWNASAAQVQAALQALSQLGSNITCSGGPLSTVAVACTFGKNFAGLSWPALVPTSSLTGSKAKVSVVVNVKGGETPASLQNVQIVVATPPGNDPDGTNTKFCGFHS